MHQLAKLLVCLSGAGGNTGREAVIRNVRLTVQRRPLEGSSLDGWSRNTLTTNARGAHTWCDLFGDLSEESAGPPAEHVVVAVWGRGGAALDKLGVHLRPLDNKGMGKQKVPEAAQPLAPPAPSPTMVNSYIR